VEPAAEPATADSPKKRTFKYSNWADVGDDTEEEVLSKEKIDEGYAAYFQKKERYPPEECNPTPEQMTIIWRKVMGSEVPYVDFALFRPGGKKHLKKLRLEKMVLMSDGHWRREEGPGVPNYDEWMVSWNLFKTVCIMWDAVSLGVLELYEEKIRRLALLYADEWFIVVEAEDFMRAEYFETLARENKAPDGTPPIRRWECVFKAAAKDKTYWDEHVEEKVMSLRTARKTEAVQVLEEGVAPGPLLIGRQVPGVQGLGRYGDAAPAVAKGAPGGARKRKAGQENQPGTGKRARKKAAALAKAAADAGQQQQQYRDAGNARRANLQPGPKGDKGGGKGSGKEGPGGVQICFGYNNGNCNARTCPQKCVKTGKPRLHLCQKCKKAHQPPRGNACRGG
jgi:hypothetical protein